MRANLRQKGRQIAPAMPGRGTNRSIQELLRPALRKAGRSTSPNGLETVLSRPQGLGGSPEERVSKGAATWLAQGRSHLCARLLEETNKPILHCHGRSLPSWVVAHPCKRTRANLSHRSTATRPGSALEDCWCTIEKWLGGLWVYNCEMAWRTVGVQLGDGLEDRGCTIEKWLGGPWVYN